jgi:hypothetical protein
VLEKMMGSLREEVFVEMQVRLLGEKIVGHVRSFADIAEARVNAALEKAAQGVDINFLVEQAVKVEYERLIRQKIQTTVNRLVFKDMNKIDQLVQHAMTVATTTLTEPREHGSKYCSFCREFKDEIARTSKYGDAMICMDCIDSN